VAIAVVLSLDLHLLSPNAEVIKAVMVLEVVAFVYLQIRVENEFVVHPPLSQDVEATSSLIPFSVHLALV
jgi:hypothetical protein